MVHWTRWVNISCVFVSFSILQTISNDIRVIGVLVEHHKAISVLGSGKTTLLDIIANRTTEPHKGVVSYNGNTLTTQVFRKHAGYVIQADRYTNEVVINCLTYAWNKTYQRASNLSRCHV